MSHHSFILISSFVLLTLVKIGLGGVVGEKREMPPSQGFPGNSYASTGYEQYGAIPSQGYAAPVALPQQYGGAPNPYTNPGFSVQTGFEGFLVPNSWYGLLPWGLEGVLVVIVGIIVFIVLSAVILGFFAWLTGFGDYAVVKESARNLLPNRISFEAIADITNTVLDALDKYDDLQVQKAK